MSVVLPIHNGTQFLAAAVDSMLVQTMGDFELLLLDDGSTDDSLAMAMTYAARDARVKVHALAHAGLSATLNAGLRLARAPLVARMDADDIAYPERLALQVAFLDRHPEVAVVGGQVRYLDPDGSYRMPAETHPCAPEALRAAMIHYCSVTHPTVVMRREPVMQLGGYRGAFARCEDYDLWLRLEEHAAIANLPEVVLDYRIHDGSVSRRFLIQQAIDALAARASALARRNGLRDPFANATGPFTTDDLDALDLPDALRSEFLALCYFAIARYGTATDATLMAWIDDRAYRALARHRSERATDLMTRAHFAVARSAWFAGDRLGALGHGRRAVSVAPLTALRRALRFAGKRLFR